MKRYYRNNKNTQSTPDTKKLYRGWFQGLRKSLNRAMPNWMQWRVDIEIKRENLWYKCCYSLETQEFSRRKAYHLGTIDVTVVGPFLGR